MSTDGPIRVLHLIHTFDVGGAERQLITLLGAFDRERFEHHVGVLNWPGFLAGEVESDPTLKFVDFGFRHRHFLPSFARIVRYLRQNRIDVVHAHLHLVGVYARIAARIAGTPVVVYTEHSDIADRSWLSCTLERALISSTTLKITVSEEQRRLTQRREGFPSDRVVTITNSVPNELFAPDPQVRSQVRASLGFDDSHVVVGIVGRVEERKRIPSLLHVVANLAAAHPHLRALVVGDGPELASSRALASALGVAGRVVFTGRRQDVPALMRTLDVLAIASRWEGLPINMLEAMSAGVPVVSTAVGDIPEVLTASGGGISVGVDDVEALGRGVEELLVQPELRRRRGEAARAYVLRHHDAALNCRRLESLYVDLLGRRLREIADPASASAS